MAFAKRIPGVQPAKKLAPQPKVADAPDALGEMPETKAGLPKGKLPDPKARIKAILMAKMKGGGR